MTTAGESLGVQFLGGDSLLLIPEVARFLRVSDKTIRRMISGGKLRSIKVCGKRVVRMSDVNALVCSPLGQVGGPSA